MRYSRLLCVLANMLAFEQAHAQAPLHDPQGGNAAQGGPSGALPRPAEASTASNPPPPGQSQNVTVYARRQYVPKEASAGTKTKTSMLLSGMVLNYGVYDAACAGHSFERFSDPAYMLTREEMHLFWSRYLPDAGQRLQPLASPLRADLRYLPPCFLAIAECDVLADENRAMAARLAEAGVHTTAVTYPGTTHSFLEAVSIAAVAGRALQEQADWMRARA